MGTTGSAEAVAMNSALPAIIARVKKHATVPIAVGFGVAARSHFDTVTNAGAEGAVIGSRIIRIIQQSPGDQFLQNVEAFCHELTKRGDKPPIRSASVNSVPKPANRGGPKELPSDFITALPARIGQFGGQYVPGTLFDCLLELEEAHKSAMADPAFLDEFRSFYGYMNRPSWLYFAENLTKIAGGAKIWLKREDLWVHWSFILLSLWLTMIARNHTGSHKINNAVGQVS
jgi:tryptophan synthase